MVLVLLEKGYMVQAASDGYEATQVFPEFDPDLVVFDMRMPKMSGPTTCAVIRQISQVPIIMFTSTTDRIAFHLGKAPASKKAVTVNPVQKTVSVAPSPSGKKPTSTTLIIDPDVNSRTTIKAVLTRLNQNVIEVSTAAEAIREFKLQTPEIIISEWPLPDMDGFSMLNEITSLTKSRKLSKLIMSSRLTP